MSKGIIQSELTLEARAKQEKKSVEPRTNHEESSVEVRVKCDELALKRRGTGENLFMNPRGSRDKLSNEQLAIQIQAGIDVADNMAQLWQQNKGLIGKEARKYSHKAEEEDLKQEAYFGLCEAVERWEPDSGYAFTTYAMHWVKQKMIRYIKNNGTVRLSDRSADDLMHMKRFKADFYKKNGRYPTDQELCRGLGIRKQALERIKTAAVMDSIGSLDVNVGEDNDTLLSDAVPSGEDMEENAVADLDFQNMQKTLWSLVDEIPEQQAKVIRMRYQDNGTLQAIGDELGYTRQNIDLLYRKGLRTLRMPSRSRQLLPYYKEYIEAYAYNGTGLGAFERTWTSSTERAVLQLEEMIEREKAAVYRDDGELAYMEKRLEELKKQEIV